MLELTHRHTQTLTFSLDRYWIALVSWCGSASATSAIFLKSAFRSCFARPIFTPVRYVKVRSRGNKPYNGNYHYHRSISKHTHVCYHRYSFDSMTRWFTDREFPWDDWGRDWSIESSVEWSPWRGVDRPKTLSALPWNASRRWRKQRLWKGQTEKMRIVESYHWGGCRHNCC